MPEVIAITRVTQGADKKRESIEPGEKFDHPSGKELNRLIKVGAVKLAVEVDEDEGGQDDSGAGGEGAGGQGGTAP